MMITTRMVESLGQGWQLGVGRDLSPLGGWTPLGLTLPSLALELVAMMMIMMIMIMI